VRAALPLCTLLLAAGAAAAAEPLGRLFYTPAQRAQLDTLRSQRNIAPPVVPEQQEPVPVPEVITYGGIVRRSDGRTTVWINNHAINDGKDGNRSAVVSRVQADGSVAVEVPQTSRNVKLKVGQSVDIVSGAVAEPYARRRESVSAPSKPAVPGGPNAALKRDTAPAGSTAAVRDEEDDERGRR
jgi:hypothetical protein